MKRCSLMIPGTGFRWVRRNLSSQCSLRGLLVLSDARNVEEMHRRGKGAGAGIAEEIFVVFNKFVNEN
jgi:hypothetical protein